MTISRDLFLAILAMDSYNRGYDVPIEMDESASSIGNATIVEDSEQRVDITAGRNFGFYASVYHMSGVAGFSGGEYVIAYRGSDNFLGNGGLREVLAQIATPTMSSASGSSEAR